MHKNRLDIEFNFYTLYLWVLPCTLIVKTRF